MLELTLPEHLHLAASKHPQLGINYIRDDGSIDFQSYPELLQEATGMACGLISGGMKQGSKAIIATNDNRQTITLLWACFISGIVPTILQPPVTFTDFNPSASKLLNVFRQLGNPVVFTSVATHSSDKQLSDKMVVYSDIPFKEGEPKVNCSFEDLAFIQFSSGSTGEPKGIMLTHRNLAMNIEAIIAGLDLQPHDHGGNWMPLYHDMGLIGYHLTPIYCPCQQYHIDTVDFIKNPGLWLDMMSQQKITVTGCPNFGQALVLRYIKRKSEGQNWDFSPVKAMLNGAEPISVKIVDEFSSAMKKYGFANEAMMPVYGMAEATLAISFSPLMKSTTTTTFDVEMLDNKNIARKIPMGSNVKQGRTIISVGTALKYVEIRIADEQENELGENNVGHIQVKGGSVTRGYYENPDASAQAFNGEWLKTGDMGFIFENNLYISGRYKDIIFMNGKNYFAHDLENLACSLEDINYGKIAFGGITDQKTGKEKVLVFLAGIPETKAMDMLHQLRVLLRKNLGIQLDELILIRSNEIPKTSSGKIQRYRLIQRYQQGEFKENRFK
jgi:acyl-CoA synthetase (AMP-forming)/AMP-acid ligase II